MPLQSEIIQRLSGDNSNLRSVFNQSERLADETGKAITKKLDISDATKAIAMAVGLNIQDIAEGFARTIVGLSKEAEDALAKIAEASERSAAAVQRSLDARRTTLQQISKLQNDIARSTNAMNDAANAAPSQSFKVMGVSIARNSAVDKILGLSRKEDAARAVKLAEAERDIKEQSFELEQKTQKLTNDNLDQQVRNQNVRADYVRANREQVELEAKLLSGRILPAEKARLDVLQMQGKQREIDQRIEDILSKYPEERTQKEKEQLITLERQKTVLDKQIDAKEKLIAASKAQTKVEEKTGEVIESNLKKWEEFIGVVESRGRSDKDLSDRELERKIANINAELAVASGASLGTFQGAGGALNSNSDFMTSQQRGAAAQAQAELDFRRSIRQQAAQFGEDATFRRNTGISEQRFREILQTAPGTKDVVDELKKLNGHLGRGIPTVLMGSEET